MRLVRFLIGVLLLPWCWVVTRTAMSLAQHAQAGSDALVPASTWAFVAGFMGWLLIFYVLPTPVRTYVLAHELTHALWGTLMGARVSKIKIEKRGGYVALSKTNFLIALAPYFFPLYTMLVILTYWILSIPWDMRRYYLVWLALVGFTWGFHFTFTITTLLQHQTDVHQHGRLFSYAIIYLCNVLGVCLWIVAVSSVTLGDVPGFAARHTRNVVAVLKHCWVHAAGLLQ